MAPVIVLRPTGYLKVPGDELTWGFGEGHPPPPKMLIAVGTDEGSSEGRAALARCRYVQYRISEVPTVPVLQ